MVEFGSSPMSYIPIRLIYTISSTVWPQYTTRQTDRQADRAMAIGRLSYSIGGVRNHFMTAEAAAAADIDDSIMRNAYASVSHKTVMAISYYLRISHRKATIDLHFEQTHSQQTITMTVRAFCKETHHLLGQCETRQRISGR